MKIVIYGISRSGKDHLIKKTMEICKGELFHMKGSTTLQDLSKVYFNQDFQNLAPPSQALLRDKFVEIVNNEETKHRNIIVDGHYSFPQDNQFDVVFRDSDKYLYDVFIYLNKSTEQTMKNSKSLGINQWSTYLESEENINRWKSFELEELKKQCHELGKELIIFDDDTNTCITFIKQLLEGKILLSESASEMIADEVLSKTTSKEVFLIDCDKTLSINDITLDIMDFHGMSMDKVKHNFSGNYYTIYQFFRFHNMILNQLTNYDESISQSIAQVRLNERLIQNLLQISITRIGMTTGIADAWSIINNNMNIFDPSMNVFGKYRNHGYLISSHTKYLVAKKLKECGLKVYAIGDSIIDIPMLETSHYGWIIANDKLSNTVKAYFDEHKDTKICQLEYSKHKYKGIKVDSTIWLK